MSDYFGHIGQWEQPRSFFVRGAPKPQPRQRHFAKKMGNGKCMARSYDPGTAEGWKSLVAVEAKNVMPADMIDQPIKVDITFLMPRPKGHFRTGKFASELKHDAPFFHTGRVDIDNLTKAVLDALTQIGFWVDDGLVVKGTITKRYPGPGETSGADIFISVWSGG